MNTEDIWNSFLSKIKSKVSLMTYNYVFSDMKLYSYNDSSIKIIIPVLMTSSLCYISYHEFLK